MRNILLILSFLTVFHSIKTDKEILPVFLIDDSRIFENLIIEPNPFYKMSRENFSSIVQESIRKSEVVILFIEDRFSVEDISYKDTKGTPYQNLHTGLLDSKVKYLPQVVNPYKLLTQIFKFYKSNVFYLSGDEVKVIGSSLKYFYVFFRDGNSETRAEALRKHDGVMREVYLAVRQVSKGPVVAFYTGKVNPVRVEKTGFSTISPIDLNKAGVVIVTDGALFRLTGVYSATQTRRSVFNQIPIVAEERWSKNSLATKMAYTDFDLEFNFNFKDTDWTLDSVALLEDGEEVGRTNLSVGAKWNWSFFCSDPMLIHNGRDGSSVIISEYKIQPLRDRRNPSRKDKVKKSHSDDAALTDESTDSTPETPENVEWEKPEFAELVIFCNPFFSIGIIAGLFVVAILLGILSFAVIALSNCHSYDRYEDPHNKGLVFAEH